MFTEEVVISGYVGWLSEYSSNRTTMKQKQKQEQEQEPCSSPLHGPDINDVSHNALCCVVLAPE